MYGRGNIFNRDVNTNNTNNTTSYGSNNYRSNNNNTFNSNEQLGSYRLEYKFEQPASYLCSAFPNWKQYPPSSIVTKQQTLHLTSTEFRIEDYYLIRKKQLKGAHDQKLRDAIRKESFNEQILRCESHKLPPISKDKPVDIDAIRSGRYNTSGNTNYNSASNNTFGSGNYGGNNNSSSGGNNSSGNSPFNLRGNTTPTSNNIFASNSGSANNVFMRNTNGGANNANSGGNNNSSSTNIFSNTRSGGNTGNTNTGGNIFNSNSNNNNTNTAGSNNIFSNSNSNNGASQNAFNNNGGSNNNIFNSNKGSGSANGTGNNNNFNSNNNSSSGGNIFGTTNNNNNNNKGGSNLFNNGGNNQNNQGNSLFNGNNAGKNNLFLNNSSNNGNNLLNSNGNNMSNNSQQSLFANNNNSLQRNLQAFLCENRQFLQMILANKTGQDFTQGNANQTQDTNQRLSLFDQRFREDDFMEIDSRTKKRGVSPQSVIYVHRQEGGTKYKQWNNEINYNNLGQSQRIMNNFTESRIENGQSEILNNFSNYNEGNKISKSKLFYNESRLMGNNQSRIPQRQRETYSRNQTMNRQTRYGDQSKMRSKQLKELIWDQQCELEMRLKIVWLDDLKNQITQQDRCRIQGSVSLQQLNTNDQNSKQEIVNRLKWQYPFVRTDAQLIIDSCSKQSNIFSIDGRLQQRIINLNSDERQGYKIFYSHIKKNLLFNLTISNSYGTVCWERPIELDLLDFKENIDAFSIDNNMISCEVQGLNSTCRVTFNDLPGKIKSLYNQNPELGKKKFQEQLKKINSNFIFSEIWRDGDTYSWSMAVTKFNEDEEQMND